ncbi:MAG: hypothetical protein EOP24_36860 [Hyphomicrobiales bacterium]|nr:MAG: hypothetical protein EOP24_36860 [Hyphomicrobiales bacterium]
MATLLFVTLIASFFLHLLSSGGRWMRVVGVGLLIYAFPVHFLAITLIAGGFMYYLDTRRKN